MAKPVVKRRGKLVREEKAIEINRRKKEERRQRRKETPKSPNSSAMAEKIKSV